MRNVWIALFLAGCAGGGNARYSEADHQKSCSQDLGTTFEILLPESKAKPVFSPNVLALTKDSVDEPTHRRTLEFSARALGETDIRVGPDFWMHVTVTSGSDRPGMHLNH
jgi:hypothetical protein